MYHNNTIYMKKNTGHCRAFVIYCSVFDVVKLDVAAFS